MDPSVILRLCILIILLALSAFFSSSETALTTVNVHTIRALVEDGNRQAKRVLQLIENPAAMLSSILIGNNLVNISATSLATTLAIDVFGSVIYYVTKVLTPVVIVINKLSTGLLMLLRIDAKQSKQVMTERELRTIVDARHEDGVIEKDEKEMIYNVFDFKDSIAKDIMIPRIDITFVSADASYDEVMELFMATQYSRLPVYEETKDKVIGIVYLKDIYFYRTQHRGEIFHIRDVLRKPFFTYETQKISSLLTQMQQENVSFSIVLDEYGITAGLITLEDILEELVGEIRDEYDESESESFQELEDGSYLVNASLKLDDLNDLIDTEIESEDYDSVGGYVIELLDHLPSEGETASDASFDFKVRKVEKNRLELIQIIRKTPQR